MVSDFGNVLGYAGRREEFWEFELEFVVADIVILLLHCWKWRDSEKAGKDARKSRWP